MSSTCVGVTAVCGLKVTIQYLHGQRKCIATNTQIAKVPARPDQQFLSQRSADILSYLKCNSFLPRIFNLFCFLTCACRSRHRSKCISSTAWNATGWISKQGPIIFSSILPSIFLTTRHSFGSKTSIGRSALNSCEYRGI